MVLGPGLAAVLLVADQNVVFDPELVEDAFVVEKAAGLSLDVEVVGECVLGEVARLFVGVACEA